MTASAWLQMAHTPAGRMQGSVRIAAVDFTERAVEATEPGLAGEEPQG